MRFSLLCFVAIIALAAASSAAAEEPASSGWQSLFNGRDLEGWISGPDQSWVVEDGVIALRREFDGREHNADYLWTRETYGDFILELEFKIPERANSGVFLRTSDLADPVYTGFEVQIANSYGREQVNRGGTAGAIYDCLAPTQNAVREPGQWNQLRVTCQGPRIQVALNGAQVLEMDLDRWTLPNQNPDGSPNKFPRALKDFARRGHIGLQDHGRPVWYRNLRVQRLDAADGAFVPDDYGMVLRTPAGQTMFRYLAVRPEGTPLTANSVCCLYPVKTPGGEDVVEFAPVDHPHHRGVFLAWHAIEGKIPADFWGWGEFAPTKDRVIVNRGLQARAVEGQPPVLEVRNDWVAQGTTLIEETTTIRARQTQGVHVIDFDFRLLPRSDLTLRQTAFGGFCVKSRKDGKAVYTSPQGQVTLPPPHHLKPETDWPAAAWYDYTIALDSGPTIGAAVVDHPGNPPSAWHNLQPIAMINPCIVAPGPVALEAGQMLRLRYRLVTHDGPAPVDVLNQLAEEFRKP